MLDYFNYKNQDDGSYAYYTAKLHLANLSQKLFSLARRFHLVTLLQELIVNKELTNEELRLYYLFLDVYFDEGIQERNRGDFFSKTKVVRLIAKRAQEIKKMKNEVFIGANQTKLMNIFKNLEKKQLIIRDKREEESEVFPKIFSQVKVDGRKKKKKTWYRNTLQPGKIKGFDLIPENIGFQWDINVKDLLGEFLLGSMLTYPSDVTLKKKYKDYQEKLFDPQQRIYDLRDSCLNWLSAIEFGNTPPVTGPEELFAFLFLFEPDELKQEVRVYERMKQKKFKRPGLEKSEDPQQEIIKLLEKDAKVWDNVHSELYEETLEVENGKSK